MKEMMNSDSDSVLMDGRPAMLSSSTKLSLQSTPHASNQAHSHLVAQTMRKQELFNPLPPKAQVETLKTEI